MAIYSKKEFAEKCNMPTKNLAVYVQRKQIVLGKKGTIDDTNEVNRLFLQKREAKGKVKAARKALTQVKTNDEEDAEEMEDAGIPSLTVSTQRLKHLDALKRENEIKKQEFELAKKKGEVIPIELMKPVVTQHNQSIVVEFKNAVDEIIRIISKRKSLSIEEIAEIKGESVQAINGAIGRATTVTVSSIDKVLVDYKNKREVGEHS